MEELFATFFRAGAMRERVLGLEVQRGYRDMPEERRTITFRRRVWCDACKRAGCKACSSVGWKIANESLIVTIPPGSHAGTTLRLAKKGDSNALAESNDLHIEITEPGERADALRKAQIEYETKLASSWEEAREKKEREKRMARRALARSVALVMAISALLGGLWLHQYLSRAKVGERCSTDRDCRGGSCLVLTRSDGSFGFFAQETGRVCTSDCTTDSDCPADMKCGGVARSYFPSLVSTHADKVACVPGANASGSP